jgi:MFS family permease
VAEEEVDFMPRQALRTSAFWLLGLTFAARQLVTGSVALHLVPYLQHRGDSLEGAAVVLAIMALIGAPGRVIFGSLGDRYDKRYVLAFCFLVMSIGLLLFANTPGFLGIVFFLTLYAPTYAGGLPLQPALRGDYFGRKAFGRIAGLMAPVTMLGTFSGPVFAGWVYDVTGGYQLAFTILGAAGMVALVLALSLRNPQPDANRT